MMNLYDLEKSNPCFVNGTLDNMLIVQGVLGGVATIICGIITVLILCLKAYQKFINRIIICITLSAFLLSVSVLLQVVSKRAVFEFDGVCGMVGYLHTFTMWMMALFLVVISLYILVFLVANEDKVSRFEKPILLIIPIISAVIATIPFTTDSYGSSVAWCWIESRKKDYNRSTAGFVEEVVLGYVPQIIVTLFSSFTAMCVTCVILRQRRGTKGQYMEAVKETIVLVIYPLINILLYSVGLANRIDHYIKDPYCDISLWWIVAVSYPFIGIVTTTALLIQIIYNEYTKRKNKIKEERSEYTTNYVVLPEFPGEAEPLIITSSEPRESQQEPVGSVYSTIFLNESS